MLSLAECYLADLAETWLENLDKDTKKPTTVLKLDEAVIRELVLSDEKARAKIELMDMKMSGSMYLHVRKSKKLIKIMKNLSK